MLNKVFIAYIEIRRTDKPNLLLAGSRFLNKLHLISGLTATDFFAIKRQHMELKPMTKNVICLWYDNAAEEAATFYAQTFPDSAVKAVHRAPGDFPGGKKGQTLTVEFTVAGIPCLGLNGGPVFKHNEAFSFQIITESQKETDDYWNAIVTNGGMESECGWCKDRWGISWQITPRILIEATTNPDSTIAKRAFDAMMTMKKIDIAKIEAAINSADSKGEASAI